MNYGPLKCIMNFTNTRRLSDVTAGAPWRLPPTRCALSAIPCASSIAESHKAREAAEAVMLDIDALPAVTPVEDAIRPGAPQSTKRRPATAFSTTSSATARRYRTRSRQAAHVTRVSTSPTIASS